ncbi:MAG: YdcF family protein [Herpetosiphonaceae bacterium]|nr:YdcF family protein [Herpetosiphonaceae bacterium]
MQSINWRVAIRRILRGIIASLLLTGVTLLVLGYLINKQATRPELRSVDALLVMGAAQWDGNPSPVLQARLDEAVRLYRLGYARRIIVSGGTYPGDTRSEASVSYEYLVQQNIDPLVIVAVAEGNDTYSTLVAVRSAAQPLGVQTYLIVTDPPHLLRALKMAHDLGLASYAAPVRANRPIGRVAELKTLWREAWGYLGYILLNE